MVYLMRDDEHNEPSVRSYPDEEAALDAVLNDGNCWTDATRDEVRLDLFGDDGANEHCGVGGRWTLVDEGYVQGQLTYWQDIADKMSRGERV